MSSQDLFVKCRRGGEEGLGIPLRRHSWVGVARTGDAHSHRASGVTVSTVSDTKRSECTERCAHVRAHHSNVTHEGQRGEKRERGEREERERARDERVLVGSLLASLSL